jgi:hypothetical protein
LRVETTVDFLLQLGHANVVLTLITVELHLCFGQKPEGLGLVVHLKNRQMCIRNACMADYLVNSLAIISACFRTIAGYINDNWIMVVHAVTRTSPFISLGNKVSRSFSRVLICVWFFQFFPIYVLQKLKIFLILQMAVAEK